MTAADPLPKVLPEILPAILPEVLAGLAAAFVAATLIGSLAARAGLPLPPPGRRTGCIDGLRGYLALAVLVHHFVIWMQVSRGGAWAAPSVAWLNNLGAGGVALFFMTTGLLFYPRILVGWRDTAWVALLTTRAFRIVPMVGVGLGLVLLILALRTGARPGPSDLPAILVWLSCWAQPPLLGQAEAGRVNAYVLWSLRYEWQFYLVVLPACALAMDRLRTRAPSWVLPVALLALALALRPVKPVAGIARYLPLFALGMLAYEAQRVAGLRRLLAARAMAVPALLALVAGFTTAPMPTGPAQMLLIGVFFAAIACGNDLFGLLRTRGALALGEMSYGIYLLHGLALSLLFVEGAGLTDALPVAALPALLPACAAAVTLAAPLTYLAVERPCIRLGRRLAGLVGQPVPAGSPQVEAAP